MVDYTASGEAIAVEFVGVSGGIDLRGLDGLGERIEAALRDADYDFRVYA